MKQAGVFLRAACSTVVQSQPPKIGEVVFVEDTGQHAWTDPQGNLVMAFLDGREAAKNFVLKGIDNPTNEMGFEGDKYMQSAIGSDTGVYTEWTKYNGSWKQIKFYRIVTTIPLSTDFPNDPNGTVYYVV